MTARDVQKILGARVLVGEEFLDREITSACASDMMSDVLAYVTGSTVLLTGLVNEHVIRTAEMVDLECIVFVRGKEPTSDIIKMAEENGMVLLCTDHTLYCTSGILYSNGLTGVGRRRK